MNTPRITDMIHQLMLHQYVKDTERQQKITEWINEQKKRNRYRLNRCVDSVK